MVSRLVLIGWLLLVGLAGGCAVAPAEFMEIRLAQLDETPGFTPFRDPNSDEGDDRIYVAPEAVATERDVESAWPVKMEEGYGVTIMLKPAAVRRISRRLEDELYARLAVFADGQFIGAAPIWKRVDPELLIGGRWKEELAQYLARRLDPERRGALQLKSLDPGPPPAPEKIDLLKRAREQHR